MSAPSARVTTPARRRDPAWLGRLFWIGASLALLWPLLVATEFRPWLLFGAASRGPTLQFLATFVPPALGGDFLWLVARETWRTVAIATAGITLALAIAIPATLLCNRALSVSALSGRMVEARWSAGWSVGPWLWMLVMATPFL